MIGDDSPIRLHVVADHGLVESDKAVSLGLIVTELVINAVKYAFPTPLPGAEVVVRFDSAGDDWTLTIRDNGVGVAAKPAGGLPVRQGGLGTVIVAALVKQLGAEMTTAMDAGLSVSIRRAGRPSAQPGVA
jgi:chemotaxis protein methyltransferase CheR